MSEIPESVRSEWEDALAKSREKFDAYNLSQPRGENRPSAKHKAAAREYWLSQWRVLDLYARTAVQFGRHLDPVPAMELLRLSYLCEDLGCGIVPDYIEAARAAGRPQTRAERNDIAKAVFFLQAVEEKKIECNAPVQTVADCYNVTKQTVRNWKKNGKVLCRGIEPPHINNMEESMRHCGYRYSIIGRGAPSY